MFKPAAAPSPRPHRRRRRRPGRSAPRSRRRPRRSPAPPRGRGRSPAAAAPPRRSASAAAAAAAPCHRTRAAAPRGRRRRARPTRCGSAAGATQPTCDQPVTGFASGVRARLPLGSAAADAVFAASTDTTRRRRPSGRCHPAWSSRLVARSDASARRRERRQRSRSRRVRGRARRRLARPSPCGEGSELRRARCDSDGRELSRSAYAPAASAAASSPPTTTTLVGATGWPRRATVAQPGARRVTRGFEACRRCASARRGARRRRPRWSILRWPPNTSTLGGAAALFWHSRASRAVACAAHADSLDERYGNKSARVRRMPNSMLQTMVDNLKAEVYEARLRLMSRATHREEELCEGDIRGSFAERA